MKLSTCCKCNYNIIKHEFPSQKTFFECLCARDYDIDDPPGSAAGTLNIVVEDLGTERLESGQEDEPFTLCQIG